VKFGKCEARSSFSAARVDRDPKSTLWGILEKAHSGAGTDSVADVTEEEAAEENEENDD
jgi:hypothetical protein